MSTIFPTTSGLSSQGRQVKIRNKDEVIKFSLYDPRTVPMIEQVLIEEGLFDPDTTPTARTSLYRRLGQLADVGYIHHIGNVSKSVFTGNPKDSRQRPLDVYSDKPWKGYSPAHEITLTMIGDKWRLPWYRGDDAARYFDADMKLVAGRIVGELDLDTEGYGQVEQQLLAYVGEGYTVLFITTTERRRDEVLKRCSFLGEHLLGATIDAVMLDPSDVLFKTCEGGQKVLNNLLEATKCTC